MPARRPAVTRRQFVQMTGLTAAATGCSPVAADGAQKKAAATKPRRDPESVLANLQAGNTRFVKGELAHPRRNPRDFTALAERQAPLAVVIGCSDSRVSPELIFDVGVGELFVVRVAGNVVTGTGAMVKGSIEYAVEELGVQLVVVLGHSNCGAIKAAIKHIDDRDSLPGALGQLVDIIKPAVSDARGQKGNKVENVMKANVRRGVQGLMALKPFLAERVRKDTLKVVGASYDLRDGQVVFMKE